MKNTIILNIKGKNIDNFIRKLNKNNIDIYDIKYIKYNEIDIEVNYNDYNKIIEIKTIYEITIKQYKGIKNIKNKIIYNKYLLISILLGIFLFTILSNMIFEIEISYNNSNIRKILINELESYGIKKYHLVKSYYEIEEIKKKILNDKKDIIEWLEIERIGTKYLVKLEPRKTNNIEVDDKIYNIVSSKDAIIKSIEAYSGEIIVDINDYVKKGDVIISSNITLNGEVKDIKTALGKVYGEVWYQLRIEYPLNYYEERETGIYNNVYNLKIINKDLNFSKLKNKKIEDKIILKSDILPIYLSKQKQKEIEIINYKLNKEEAIKKATEESRKKLEKNLKEKEHIMDEKCLKIEMKDSKIILDIFYTVYENITEYIEIEG